MYIEQSDNPFGGPLSNQDNGLEYFLKSEQQKIFLGHRTGDETPLAIKLYGPKRYDQYRRERFCFERLTESNPHIIVPEDMFRFGEWGVIITPFKQSIDCKAVLEMGSMSDAIAKHVLLGVATALDAVHRQGLVHGDVSPGNALYTKERSYLLDFGLGGDASLGELDTNEHRFFGTIGYVAPEVMRGLQTYRTRETDLFSLGALTYALFTGKPPGDHERLHTMLLRLQTRNYAEFKKARPDLSEQLSAIVMQALSPKSQERSVTPQDFIQTLQQL